MVRPSYITRKWFTAGWGKTFNFCGCIYECTGPTKRKKEKEKEKEKNTMTTSNFVNNMMLNQSQIWGFK